MRTERQKASDRASYRLNKLKAKLIEAGFTVKNTYHSISVVTFTHPHPEIARVGENVEQSLAINWSDTKGYTFYSEFSSNDQLTTFSIPHVIELFKSFLSLEAVH